jgi:predicted nucleic acid-binding protein
MGMSETALPHRLYLDANIFIYAVQGEPEVAKPLQTFLQVARRFALRPVTSELTLAEILCKQDLSPNIRRLFLNLIVFNKLMDLRPVTREILIGSAELRRASPKFRLADAIHARTALDAHCTFLMTNDDRFGALPERVTIVKPDASGIRIVIDAFHD